MIFEIAVIIAGIALLIKGSDLLVDSAGRLAAAAGISITIIGLSIVALGTSLPELVVGVSSSFGGYGQVALGDVIGANIANICLIIGVGALIQPILSIGKPVTRDMLLTLGVITLLYMLAGDEVLSQSDGFILVAAAIVYFIYLFTVRSAQETEREESKPAPKLNIMDLPVLCLGIAMALVGGKLTVDAAVSIAGQAGISPFLIGVIVIALGTTLPELTTSIIASRKGKGYLVIGNSLGSVIVNASLILGICAIISPISPSRPLDIIVIMACCALLYILTIQGKKLSRIEGAILLAVYGAYAGYMIITAI